MKNDNRPKIKEIVLATLVAVCGLHVSAAETVISDGNGATWDDKTLTLKITDSITPTADKNQFKIVLPSQNAVLESEKNDLFTSGKFTSSLVIDGNVKELRVKRALFLSTLEMAGSTPSPLSEADINFKFGTIESILFNEGTSDPDNDQIYSPGVFLADGWYTKKYYTSGKYRPYTFASSSFNQVIGEEGSYIGKIIPSTSGTGLAISLTETLYTASAFTIPASLYQNQTINARIGDIGSEDKRFEIGVFKLSKSITSTKNNKISSSYQKVNKIDRIFATEGGIVYHSGMGDETNFYQEISQVGSIDVDSSTAENPYPVIVGISTQSGSSGRSPTPYKGGWAQRVSVRDKISVEGKVKNESLFSLNSKIRLNNPAYKSDPALSVENYIARVGIANFGGTQLIESEGKKLTISVGNKNKEDNFNFAILVYPELLRDLGLKSASVPTLNKNFSNTLPIISTLRGNFVVENGHIAVFGLMPQENWITEAKPSGSLNAYINPDYKEIKSELQFQTLSLENTLRNTLRLADSSKFFVTNRRWSDITQSFDIGCEGGNSTLSIGDGSSPDKNYRVVLPSAQNSLYVDGDFKGNSTFVVGSSWNETSGSIAVNQTPLVFKNIVKQDDGSATHLNIDVDVSSVLPADKVDQFDKNNALCVMNEAVQNLVIGTGKDNLELGGFDTSLGTSIENDFAITKNLALKNPDASGISANQRKAIGYVSVSTYEGLITPKTTYYTKYYLDDTKGTAKDITAVLSRVEGETKTIAQSMYSSGIATQSDEVPEEISNAYSGAGVGSVVSDRELSQNYSAADNPPGPENPNDPANPSEPSNPTGPGENKPQKTTSTMDSIDSLGMANYFIWRQENETLYQRLGEVRDDPTARGLWVKVRGGRNKYSESGNYFKNQYYGLQLGIDRPLDEEWTLGAAASYTYGDGKLTNGGKDDNWIASGSLYALGAFDDGSYLDVVLRASRIHNDFTVVSDQARYITKGKRSGNAYSASVEYGQKIPLNPNWYVDPQIQVTYGHIQGLSFTTKNGVKVNTDRVNSLIGRVGVGVGYENAKGGAFVRADVLRDFTAQYKTNYALEKAKNNSDIDLRSTWGEISVGGNYQFDKNLHGYAQAKRSVGGKLKQDYRFDFGLRYVF